MSKKRGDIDSKIPILTIVILLAIVFLFTIISDFSGSIIGITGKATSDTTALNITIGNSAPVVDYIISIPAQSVTESGKTSTLFSFTATDVDGVSNLNDTSAQARFQSSGETTRTNSSCDLVGDLDSDTANYSCSIEIWYWDGAGTWDINVTISDIAGAGAENSTSAFTLSETTAMVMSPTALTWPSISLVSVDQLSDADPITINNTANNDIADGSVEVTAVDMSGETTPTEYLLAGNFTSNIVDACEGTVMVNGTATGVTGATITAGNNSAGSGQEDLYFCLEEVSSGISQQSYSTVDSGEWTLGIS